MSGILPGLTAAKKQSAIDAVKKAADNVSSSVDAAKVVPSELLTKLKEGPITQQELQDISDIYYQFSKFAGDKPFGQAEVQKLFSEVENLVGLQSVEYNNNKFK